MDRSAMAAVKLTWQRLVFMAGIFMVLSTCTAAGGRLSQRRERARETCKDCAQDIGTAMLLTRQNSRALRGLPSAVQRAAGTRDLKQSGACSETDSSLYAVLECTNAVRQDPDAYANEYPCVYQSWRDEISGKGLGPLGLDQALIRMAQLHTDDQASINVMTHTGSDGSSLSTRADRAHYEWSSLGENVAVGFDSAKDVVMAWMCSAGHRKNLMSCTFDSIGIGEAHSVAGRHYFTQNFGCSFGEVCGCSGPTETPPATATGTDAASTTSTPGPYFPGGRPATDMFDVGQVVDGQPTFPEPYSAPPTLPEPSPPPWVTSYFAEGAAVPTQTGAPVDAVSGGDAFVLPTTRNTAQDSSTATATSGVAPEQFARTSPGQYAANAGSIASRSCSGWEWDCGYSGDVWSCRRKPRCR